MLERYLQSAIACSREIDAPAAVVWSVMSNVGSQDKTLSGVARVERLDKKQEEECTELGNTIFDDGEDEERRMEEQPQEDVGIRVGMRYRIYRELQDGEHYFADWDITHVRYGDDDVNVEPTSSSSWREAAAYSVTFYSTNIAGGEITASSTWTVRSAGEKRSIASISIAYIPRRICLNLGRIVCSCLLKRKAIKLTEVDLEDFAVAAERIANEQKVE